MAEECSAGALAPAHGALEQSSSPISDVFDRCKAEGFPALVAFLTAGFPTLELTPRLLSAAVDGGADIIELGFPYSDPLADGPIIQASSHRALDNGATFDWVLEMASQCRPRVPLVAFSYYNPLFVRGLDKTAGDLAAAGFAGVIVPDLPPEEAQPLADVLGKRNLSLTFLVAPTTPTERAAEIAARCTDFVYVVSRMGVTGTSAGFDDEIKQRLQALRSITDKPLAVGFGVSRREQAAALAGLADGIIVGSALVEACAAPDAPAAVRRLCQELKADRRAERTP